MPESNRPVRPTSLRQTPQSTASLVRCQDTKLGKPTKMASDTDTCNTDRKPSALICAPCWVCLEDGPDEAGEPLVRNCSCRGETSAGYHLSCIVNYAKNKTQKFMKSGRKVTRQETERLMNGDDPVQSTWLVCPNCSGAYLGTVSNGMAAAMIETTQHLPGTHWVRYSALTSFVEQRHMMFEADVCFCTTDSHANSPPFDEIDALLRITEEETSALVLSITGQKMPEKFMARFRSSLISNLLTKKGHLLDMVGKQKEALHCFETASAKLGDSLISAALNGSQAEKAVLFEASGDLHSHKVKMGLTTPSDDVKYYRKYLAAQTEPSEQIHTKANLATALTKLDPPEYFEAIKLWGEVCAVTKLIHGPEHGLSLYHAQQAAKAKEDYRDYLQSIANKK